MTDNAPPDRPGGPGGWPRDEGSATRQFNSPHGDPQRPGQGDPEQRDGRGGEGYGPGPRREGYGPDPRGDGYGPDPRRDDGYGRSPSRQGPPRRDEGFQPWDEYRQAPGPSGEELRQLGTRVSTGAGAVAGRAVSRVRGMSWQELALRIPGAVAVLAGVCCLLSCFFPWHSIFQTEGDRPLEIAVAPFRGAYVSGASRLTEQLIGNTFDSEALDTLGEVTMYVGVLVVIAALLFVLGGLAVATNRYSTAGFCAIVTGIVVLGYARVVSGVVGNFAEVGHDIASAAGVLDPDLLESISGGDLGYIDLQDIVEKFIPEAGFGLGLTTFALWIAVIGVVVYLAMIVYREWIRFQRWSA